MANPAMRSALALSFTLAPAVAQATAERVLVVTSHATQPLARLLEVDPASGAVLPIAQPNAIWPLLEPVAMTVDPATGDVLLASFASQTTLVWRIRLAGPTVVADQGLAALPGRAVAITVQVNGDVFVAIDDPLIGGVHRLRRDGTASVFEWGAPNISAMSENVILPTKYWVVQDHQLPSAPGATVFLSSAAGNPVGMVGLPFPAGTRITGVHEYTNGFLHAGIREQMFSDTLGNLFVTSNFQWAVLWVTPTIAPGGARRLKPGPGRDLFLLGGAADPTLKCLPIDLSLAFPPVTVVAGPLPGDPVDLAWTGDRTARAVPFGDPCSAPSAGSAGRIAANGTPRLGNAAFGIGLDAGIANAPALLAVGATPSIVPLPIGTVPCFVHFLPDAFALQLTDAIGAASQSAPVPNAASLAGAIAFAQWWQFAPGSAELLGSDSIALRLWP